MPSFVWPAVQSFSPSARRSRALETSGPPLLAVMAVSTCFWSEAQSCDFVVAANAVGAITVARAIVKTVLRICMVHLLVWFDQILAAAGDRCPVGRGIVHHRCVSTLLQRQANWV